jgi:hypothetical protein
MTVQPIGVARARICVGMGRPLPIDENKQNKGPLTLDDGHFNPVSKISATHPKVAIIKHRIHHPVKSEAVRRPTEQSWCCAHDTERLSRLDESPSGLKPSRSPARMASTWRVTPASSRFSVRASAGHCGLTWPFQPAFSGRCSAWRSPDWLRFVGWTPSARLGLSAVCCPKGSLQSAHASTI